jgi:anti-sigma B factor antagonist
VTGSSAVPTSSDDGSVEPAPFTVRTVPWAGVGPGQAVVSVAGDVDMHSEGRLREELVRLSEAPARQVVLDFSGVEFMASAGVHVLLEMSARLEAAGGSLALACLHPMVARVMSLTGADELVPVLPTVAEALARQP